jgi:hypothetical protein
LYKIEASEYVNLANLESRDGVNLSSRYYRPTSMSVLTESRLPANGTRRPKKNWATSSKAGTRGTTVAPQGARLIVNVWTMKQPPVASNRSKAIEAKMKSGDMTDVMTAIRLAVIGKERKQALAAAERLNQVVAREQITVKISEHGIPGESV